jgi:competence ComEA-like helix-hairpin-helix protein
MKTLLQDKSSTNVVCQSLARLGAAHGYRFAADTVHLNAMFTVLDPAAHQRAWALQLWACPAVPATAAELAGQLVAEIPLPPIGELADDTHGFEVSTNALVPAGFGEQVMVLVLAADCAGASGEVQDFAVYPRREQFFQPRLAGNVGFLIKRDRMTLEVERIENPRDAANVSGTLALELWALNEPYRGGRFQGAPLAGVALDPLAGQFEYRHRSFELPFTPPPAGVWNLVLMLREWTANGYVTRDFTNFALPLTVAAPTVETRGETKPQPVAAARENEPTTVSINSASRNELVAVKGLPPKVAEGIVSKRPFSSVDELVKVKGMGARLLAKLRSRLRL